jgi:hypothetical protein
MVPLVVVGYYPSQIIGGARFVGELPELAIARWALAEDIDALEWEHLKFREHWPLPAAEHLADSYQWAVDADQVADADLFFVHGVASLGVVSCGKIGSTEGAGGMSNHQHRSVRPGKRNDRTHS